MADTGFFRPARGTNYTKVVFFLLFKRLADALSEMTRSYVTDEQASSPAKQQVSETASLLETVSVPKRLRSTCFFFVLGSQEETEIRHSHFMLGKKGITDSINLLSYIYVQEFCVLHLSKLNVSNYRVTDKATRGKGRLQAATCTCLCSPR